MVAVFNKELLSWYLITLKLKETVEANIPQSPKPRANPLKLLQLQKQPSQSLQFSINPKSEIAKTPEPDRVITIRQKIEQASQDDVASTWSKLCIYRVPECLKEADKAYTPQIVSLGPYHHGKKRLQSMDRHKWRALNHILKRTRQDIRVYLDSIKEVEEKARGCYEGQIKLSSSEFVEMMVLDGCFVLELFQGASGGFKNLGYSRNDPVFAMRGSMHSIQRDMIMLENQIPLFVLDRLLGLHFGGEQRGLVAKLAVRFFDPLMPTDEPLRKSHRNWLETSLAQSVTFDPLSDQGGLHCLDVFRCSLLRKGPRPEPRIWIRRRSDTSQVADKRRQQLIYCVTELSEAGIKFRKRKTDRFWDVRFKSGILKIPRILIHDGTMSLFLNLIAFEQFHLDSSNDITSYVIFMNNLINSPADVAYLHYHGIIEHWLGSDVEVAELFHDLCKEEFSKKKKKKNLCKEVVLDINNSYLSGLSEKVNRYYNHKWNAWRASLKHNYFSNPWAVISFFAAVVLLLLTFAQTFYAVYGYYNPGP